MSAHPAADATPTPHTKNPHSAAPPKQPAGPTPHPLGDLAGEIQKLIAILPPGYATALHGQHLNDLIEITLDLGRPPEARFRGRRYIELSEHPVNTDDLQTVVNQIGAFTSDNRAGIPATLHRISAMRNRAGDVVGLTCRVGKALSGTIEPMLDLIESGKSVLLLGPPGVGKTTKLREIARHLANHQQQRVVIVDTSNEIAGDGDIPHPSVGRARRMQVSGPERQKDVMIEAVENHTPEVILVDEIGTEDEAMAARTIAERGVILVATAHGGSLENVIKNPMLSDLIGGIQTVTLGDDEAKRRNSQKTVLERAKAPTFDVCIEIRDLKRLAVYPDVAEAVDHILQGWTIFPEVREVDEQSGSTVVLSSSVNALPPEDIPPIELNSPNINGQRVTQTLTGQAPANAFRVYPYGLSKDYITRICERLNLNHVVVTGSIHEANAMLALQGSARPGSKMMTLANDYRVPVTFVKANAMPHIQKGLRDALGLDTPLLDLLDGDQQGSAADKVNPSSTKAPSGTQGEVQAALEDARTTLSTVQNTSQATEMAPQRSYIRRLQHELVETEGYQSVSVGREPHRRLKILPKNT